MFPGGLAPASEQSSMEACAEAVWPVFDEFFSLGCDINVLDLVEQALPPSVTGQELCFAKIGDLAHIADCVPKKDQQECTNSAECQWATAEQLLGSYGACLDTAGSTSTCAGRTSEAACNDAAPGCAWVGLENFVISHEFMETLSAGFKGALCKAGSTGEFCPVEMNYTFKSSDCSSEMFGPIGVTAKGCDCIQGESSCINAGLDFVSSLLHNAPTVYVPFMGSSVDYLNNHLTELYQNCTAKGVNIPIHRVDPHSDPIGPGSKAQKPLFGLGISAIIIIAVASGLFVVTFAALVCAKRRKRALAGQISVNSGDVIATRIRTPATVYDD